jgi:hypothetical protein
MSSKRESRSGEEIRAAACAEGLPPMVASATQISTRLAGNIVAFRGSGAIPPGLYHSIFTGEGRPKPVTEKAKSSNIGPQAGRAAEDPRNGRYDKNETGEYLLRPDKPPKGLDAQPLELSLRNIISDLGTKYQLTPNDNNPDKAGILRFCENHPSPDVKAIVYSVNINEAKKIPQEIRDNYKLVSNHLEEKPNGMINDERFKDLPLDSLCFVSAQHPSDNAPKVIKVLGGIVRDCDIDFITDPPAAKMESLLGTKHFKKFLEPLDMSPHLHSHDGHTDKVADKAEKIRASTARDNMVYMLLEINNLKWEKYNNLKDAAMKTAGANFNQEAWELENAHLKPFVPENSNLGLMSAMVVTVGKGTPMQLYQALEINIIQQKILSSCTSPDGTRVNMENIDNSDKNISNNELLKLHKQPISYSKETIARSFIQHPSECHNEHYTSPRGTSVLVKGDTIKMEKDPALAQIVQNSGQYIPINKQWINPSAGSGNAKVWVEHFLRNEELYRGKKDDAAAVSGYLKNDKNIDFIVKLQNEFTTHPNAHGTKSAENYLNKFLSNNVDIRKRVEEHRESAQNENATQGQPSFVQNHARR